MKFTNITEEISSNHRNEELTWHDNNDLSVLLMNLICRYCPKTPENNKLSRCNLSQSICIVRISFPSNSENIQTSTMSIKDHRCALGSSSQESFFHEPDRAWWGSGQRIQPFQNLYPNSVSVLPTTVQHAI